MCTESCFVGISGARRQSKARMSQNDNRLAGVRMAAGDWRAAATQRLSERTLEWIVAQFMSPWSAISNTETSGMQPHGAGGRAINSGWPRGKAERPTWSRWASVPFCGAFSDGIRDRGKGPVS